MNQQPPLFVKIKTSKKTSKKIMFLQQSFERYGGYLLKRCPNNEERQLGMRKLQEACVWFCRSMAVKDFVPDVVEEIITTEPVIKILTPEEIAEQEEDEEAIKKANAPAPVIIIKKRVPFIK